MGTRFRKSINLGPLRINLSQSGVGFSIGNKFARITQKADGNIRTTTTIPGTGISHVEEHKVKTEKPAAAEHSAGYEKIQKRREETRQMIEEARRKQAELHSKWEHVTFELADVLEENEDGVRRQTLLRKVKEKRPPFDKERVVSLTKIEGSDEPQFSVSVNGYVVGTVPPKAAASIAEKWERIDCISAFEPYGRSTAHDYYGAQVYVRFHATPLAEVTPPSAGSINPVVLGVLAAFLIFAAAGCSSTPENAPTPVEPVQQEQVDEQAPQTDAETQPEETLGEIQTQPEPDPTPSPDPVVEPEPDPQPTPEPQPVTTPDPTPQPTPEPGPQPEQAEPVATLTPEQAFRESLKQYAYVGSSESDKYHKPTCRWTSKINDGNLVHFDSVEEAQAAGYEPCGTCKPK